RRSATRRASVTSATEQQPESPLPPHNFIVAPTTSWPSSINNAAATAESTPPDIATSIRMPSILPSFADLSPTEAPNRPDRRFGGDLDVDLPRRTAEAEPNRLTRVPVAPSHRGEHVRGLERPGRAR